MALDGLAAIAVEEGRLEPAAALAGAAEATYEAVGAPLEPLEAAFRARYVEKLKGMLEPEALGIGPQVLVRLRLGAHPQADALLRLGLRRLARGAAASPAEVQPLYLFSFGAGGGGGGPAPGGGARGSG